MRNDGISNFIIFLYLYDQIPVIKMTLKNFSEQSEDYPYEIQFKKSLCMTINYLDLSILNFPKYCFIKICVDF